MFTLCIWQAMKPVMHMHRSISECIGTLQSFDCTDIQGEYVRAAITHNSQDVNQRATVCSFIKKKNGKILFCLDDIQDEKSVHSAYQHYKEISQHVLGYDFEADTSSITQVEYRKMFQDLLDSNQHLQKNTFSLVIFQDVQQPNAMKPVFRNRQSIDECMTALKAFDMTNITGDYVLASISDRTKTGKEFFVCNLKKYKDSGEIEYCVDNDSTIEEDCAKCGVEMVQAT